ncbi:MAG TPA: PHP-associated domain-containing protein [Bryobacteraceae bacterium]|nr:PHP-associated domain-containing protein [Bryobacteraceae bacterium]
MKCDLHVHTIHSGMCTIPLIERVCRECYSDPADVYGTLKQRGMDLVTVTDHDSIDAAESLRKYPDFFLSEEVSCILPSGTNLHMGVYDIQERDHVELQRRATDFPSLLAYLRERNLFFTVNHVYSSLTGRRAAADFDLFGRVFPGVEVLNGQMLAMSNAAARDFASQWRRAPIAGSDAHTIAPLASAYTSIPNCASKQDFLDQLRNGHGIACGESGNYGKLATTVFEIASSMAAEKPWIGLLLSPLLAAIPVAVLLNYVRELVFYQRWSRTSRRNTSSVPVEVGPASEVSA